MPDHYGKKRQIDMDTPVDAGADVADALRDLTPEQFNELMSEMGQELFGPPDPRPTYEQARAEAKFVNRHGPFLGPYYSYDTLGVAEGRDRWHSGSKNMIAERHRKGSSAYYGRGDGYNPPLSGPITKGQYEEMRAGSGRPNEYDGPLPEYEEYLDAFQKIDDLTYPEMADAERKARMDALKSRVRERMSRFKM